MKPLDRPLLADENINPEVVSNLRNKGKDIRSVHDVGLTGAGDAAILRRAHEQGRVVLTHDSDFGTLVIRGGQPHAGIIYLRPGNISASVVMEMLDAIEKVAIEVDKEEMDETQIVLVADRRGDSIRLRIRFSDPLGA